MEKGGPSEPAMLAGRYELGPLLGHGGMGAVHDATDRRLGRRVAVKILRADLAEQSSARRRFETEAHSAARLAHPNVVTVFDSGEAEGVPFIVMERLPGLTLADELEAGPLSVDRVRAVGSEILSALEAAHSAGIIHRDIKPGNVLLTDDGHVKVSDFGIAKTVDDIDQTQTTALVATPQYLAPERLAGEPASQRSDLYSVGVLLYVALSGRRPFEGDTPLAVLRAIERGCAEPLSSVLPGHPAGFLGVVERAMSREPNRRFASAGEMAAALDHSPELDLTVPIDADNKSEALPVHLGSHDGETRVLHVLSPKRAGRESGTSRRRPLVALVVSAAAVTATVAAVVSNRNQVPPVSSLPTTTVPTAPATPASAQLPAPLDDAIRQLEQAVAR